MDSRRLNKQQFLEHAKTKRVYVRILEIIGKASKAISHKVKTKYSQVAWTAMARICDRLIHHYFEIDYELV